MYNSENTNDAQAELETVQSHYRTINASLQGAKQRGSKADIRELTRAKNRISHQLDTLKSKLKNTQSF